MNNEYYSFMKIYEYRKPISIRKGRGSLLQSWPGYSNSTVVPGVFFLFFSCINAIEAALECFFPVGAAFSSTFSATSLGWN